MKKIGTISLNINTNDLNYGALLHSYAFQCFLNRYEGVSTEIIDYKGPNLESLNLKYPTVALVKQKHYYKALMSSLRFFSHARRYEKFKEFINEHCTVSQTSYNQQSLDTAKLDYDIIVCESDVIWSPNITQPGFDKTFFLALNSMRNTKRVAYAASLANGLFTKEQQEEFAVLLENLGAISCRETYASDYVRELTGRDAKCVVDPVLLLDEEDYTDITADRLIKDPYVLLYMPIEYSRATVSKVRQYAKTKGLKVVEISAYPFDIVLQKTIRDAGIDDYLSLIKNAEVVFSNSFHAVCFSVIFKKDFYAFTRKTGRKIEDICSRLGLENRFIKGWFKEQNTIDYELVYDRLRELRAESIAYIETNIVYN